MIIKTKQFIKILISCFILMSFSTCFALSTNEEEIENYDISFEQAYELMLENSNAIKSAIENTNYARHKKNAALGNFAPKIGFNTTFAMLNSDISMSVPMIDPITLQKKNLWTLSGGAVWNIFTGGKIIAQNQAERARYEISNHKLNEVKGDLIVKLVKRYFGYCLAKDVVKVKEEVLNTVEKHLKNAEISEKEGIIPKSERLHAQVAYAKAERELKASKRDERVARNALFALIKAQSVNTDTIDITPSSKLFMYEGDFPSVEDFKKSVLTNNPLLKQSEYKQKALKAKYHAELANYSPTISLGAYDIMAADDLSGLAPRMAFGAMANYTIFDGFSRLNNVKAAKSETLEAKYSHEDVKISLLTLTEKNYQEVLKYKEQYESTEKSIEDAKEALRISTLSFNEGMTASLNVTDAQTALMVEKIQRLYAIYNYDVALCELLKLIGEPELIVFYVNNSINEELDK